MEDPNILKVSRQLWEDHQKVQNLHNLLLETPDPPKRDELVDALFVELEGHAYLEERLVYPFLASNGMGPDQVRHFAQQHGEIRRLISDYRLSLGRETDLVGLIMAHVERHVTEEETLAFPLLGKATDPVDALADDMASLKTKLARFPSFHRTQDLEVPARVAYDQWTQFQSFPAFLESVKEVSQVDDSHLVWRAEVGGKELQWTAEIYEQIPDQRIAWQSQGGTLNTGSVSFLPLSQESCRLLVEITYEPQGLLENLGSMVGLLPRYVATNLDKFKAFIEVKWRTDGAWRGRIQGTGVDSRLRPSGSAQPPP